MLTMNEKDKNKMLEAILNKNEAYQCKLWAVIMAGADWSNIRYLCTDWRTFYTDRGGCRCIGRTEQCLLLSGSYRATPEYGHCKFR